MVHFIMLLRSHIAYRLRIPLLSGPKFISDKLKELNEPPIIWIQINFINSILFAS